MGFYSELNCRGALCVCLASQVHKGEEALDCIGRSQPVGEESELTIVSPFPWKHGVTCLTWRHQVVEVLQRAGAGGELQGA